MKERGDRRVSEDPGAQRRTLSARTPEVPAVAAVAVQDRFDNYITPTKPPDSPSPTAKNPPEGIDPTARPAAPATAATAAPIIRTAHQDNTAAARRGSRRGKTGGEVEQLAAQRQLLRNYVASPLAAPYRCVVSSTRGAPGGTTAAAVLALTIADITARPTALIAADPAGDTLTRRVSGQPVTEAQNWQALVTADQRHRLIHDDQGLPPSQIISTHLLAADANPAVRILSPRSNSAETYSRITYRDMQEAIGAAFGPIITDIGRDITHPAAEAALTHADLLLLVAPLRGSNPTETVRVILDQVAAQGHHALAESAVVLLCETAPTDIAPEPVVEQLRALNIPAAHLPYDPHLALDTAIDPDQLSSATLDAVLYLAAVIAQRAAARGVL